MFSMLERRKYGTLVAMFAAAGVTTLLLRVFDPATSAVFPPCPVRYLTGWYCPGCGTLRALHQLLEGNFRAAWDMNPLTILLLPFLTYGGSRMPCGQSVGVGCRRCFCRRCGCALWARGSSCLALPEISRFIPLTCWHRGRCSSFEGQRFLVARS